MTVSRKGGDGKKRSASGKKRTPGSRRGGGTPESASEKEALVRHYYPVFESLIVFMMGPRRFVRALRRFLREELDYRTRLVVQSTAALIVGGGLLFWGAGLMVFAAYAGLKGLVNSPPLAAGLIAVVFSLLGLVVFAFMLKSSRKLFESRIRPPEEERRPRIYDE